MGANLISINGNSAGIFTEQSTDMGTFMVVYYA